MGPVLWFLGLSGSGKSTLAKSCINYLNEHGDIFPDVKSWQMLDGDVIREFLGEEIGYSYDERRKSVKIMGLLAKYLSQNNIGVIVANISPFYDLRLFMNDHMSNYYEIYCKCSISTCIKRDPKENYKNQFNKGIKDYIGLDIPFQEPENSNLILDTEKNTLQQCEKKLFEYLCNMKE